MKLKIEELAGPRALRAFETRAEELEIIHLAKIRKSFGFQLALSEGDVRLFHSVRSGGLLNVLQYGPVECQHRVHICTH